MKHALIIEDGALIAQMIGQELSEYGYRSLQIAESQEQAVRMAKERPPDLITADDRLIDGSGIAAVRLICSGQVIPVVFITGNAERIRRSVPDAVIVEKPFTHAELQQAIPAAIEAARSYT